ncbi:hypothetical protein OHA72_49180 [Dactylosporangium sp. NBC_01737]|uniref:hypothetical protein n=1 Tax=Dactylosporangium sp. NBC_01737 TaxID=2975959 RepID=UPI002E158AF5|nr:hypothetical protein OHA72_49180 [Dactylosporangium sp. NBC_01737]
MLHGVELRIVPDGPYLHADDQVRQWLAAFRQVCATNPERPSWSRPYHGPGVPS